ncbi:hypothetical protein [Acinetobacter bereziniae]|uniref:hypothetical protein n=1 Tax=Acinetobacter bereziniae TaxID=106648 RepID=UPI003AF879D7
MNLKALIIISFIMLQGCAINPNSNQITAQQFEQSISISTDNYTKITTLEGPKLFPGGLNNYFLVRAFKSHKNQEIMYQIYINVTYYGDWINFNSAFDNRGTQLNTDVIKKNVSSCIASTGKCILNEVVTINMTLDEFESNMASGIDFQISGQGGSRKYFIPPNYIQAFVYKLNSLN